MREGQLCLRIGGQSLLRGELPRRFGFIRYSQASVACDVG